MAEMIAVSFSTKVAAALARPVAAELSFLARIRSGITAAARDLELLRAFLRFADSRRGIDSLADTWVDQVRDVAFELEDVTDEYTFLSGHGFFRDCANLSAWFALSRHLRKARERLREVSAAKEQYGILPGRPVEASSSSRTSAPDGGDAAAISRKLAVTAHFVAEHEIIGLAAHTRLLMHCLAEDVDPHLTRIAVCGMGGVGKTTLATSVYKKALASCQFNRAAWVSVTKSFTVDDLLRKIVTEFHRGAGAGAPSDVGEMDYRSLVETLHDRILTNKRYLLLLDDIWDADVWFQLRGALPDHGTGSRIVITTRHQEVAALASHNKIIRLEPLPEKEAWSLFCNTAFREDAKRECPSHLENWASKILNRCDGLPMAIVAVGNLLALKERTEFAWMSVHDGLVWDESSDPGIGRVWKVLNFSISDLPLHLRRCFLYCSMYPEDLFMKRKILIRQWIAEGLIEENGHGTMEEVADNYVNELVRRSLFLIAVKNEFGRVKRCYIHDLIREVIIGISKDERSFQLSRCTRVDTVNKHRRLVLDRGQVGHQSGRNMGSLRTFYVFRSELHSSLLSGFRLLTVLSIWFVKTRKLPSAVTNLVNLRYLSIRSTYVEELPEELGKLRNLQTLDAKWSMIRTLPRSFTRLKNLRHLILFRRAGPNFLFPAPGTEIPLPDGLQNLRCLQTLKYIKADQKIVRSLVSLEQMRSLELFGVDERILVDLAVALSKMSFLLRLGIYCDANVTLDLESFNPPPVKLRALTLSGKLIGGKLPSWFVSLSSLIQLDLRSSELSEDSIGLLSSLPRLLHLSLIDAAYTERHLTFAAGSFPILTELSLQRLSSLTSIEFQKGSLADLRKLMLGRCIGLAEIPQGIENLIHLEYVELYQMPSKFVEQIPSGEGYGADHQAALRTIVVRNIFWRGEQLLEQNFCTNISTVQK